MPFACINAHNWKIGTFKAFTHGAVFCMSQLSELSLSMISRECLACEALTYWVTHVLLSQKITMTDFLRAVISILSYKVLCNLTTKCLVSAHTLLSECLTIALFFSLDLFSDLLSVCLFYNYTVSHDCSQRISSVSIAVNSQFLQRDLSELNMHTLEICHTCEALVYWVTHILLG